MAENDEQKTRFLYWWLLLALVFEYARPGSFVPALMVMKLNTILPLGLLVVVMFASGLRPFGEIFQDSVAKWIVVYLLLIMLSTLTAEVSLYAYELFKGALGYFFFFVTIVRVVTTRKRVLGVFSALIAAHLFLVAANPSLILSPESRSYVRGGTFLGDGNDFSLSLCVLIGPAIYMALAAPSGLRRIARWALVAVLLLCIVGTQSRGATLGAGAVLGVLWLGSNRKLQGLVGLAIVGLGIIAYAPDVYFERMGTIANYENEGSAQGRIIAWTAAIQMALDNPIFGVGAGNFPTAFGVSYAQPGMPWLTAHSMYFLVLGELGFPGIVTFLAIGLTTLFSTLGLRGKLLRDALPNITEDVAMRGTFLRMMACSQVGFLVAGAFLSVAYYPHVYVVSGLLLAARAIARKEAGFVEDESRRGRRAASRHRGSQSEQSPDRSRR